MNTEQIVMCIIALLLGMLIGNMLKNVCGCKVVEGGTALIPHTTTGGDNDSDDGNNDDKDMVGNPFTLYCSGDKLMAEFE
jgi:hypothetical protein